ncbi:polyprenyl synthetase family protein [Maribacter polysaccharolyticus]|uniref:polyprenyl synthetase family protein n=1 Tax=Maribacter polysaccharolyticus TaxID=3020831 RepID=UPI00237F8DE9|nr:polyprenyl synthetase family protein [Maribacter polysaccharolyticus]MDE3742379.1 polyprenyl synthetase family protein [Maribacter polysaccharolyticus]
MHAIEQYRNEFIGYLGEKISSKEPTKLYDPVIYILGLGGKRLRPVLTLMTTDLFGADYRQALDAALAIEVFHNFSLVHDDIMDDAPLRRGQRTVHEKWDINTGILSGDAMLILAYRFFENYQSDTFRELARLFSKTALEVCEGQQYDMDFETRDDVTIPEYLRMIEYKTAVLVGAAMKMGGIVAGVSTKEQDLIYDFGKNLGIAFQLQDDYLDAFGDPKTFGKQVGGDIIENKKTILYLLALQLGGAEEQKQLLDLYSIQPRDPEGKINSVKDIFITTGAAERTKEEIEEYTQKAFRILDTLQVSEEKKSVLKQFGEGLMRREV